MLDDLGLQLLLLGLGEGGRRRIGRLAAFLGAAKRREDVGRRDDPGVGHNGREHVGLGAGDAGHGFGKLWDRATWP